MRINDALRRALDDSVLCWLASADADGAPNVSPKEVFAPLGDDRIVIAEIASARSAANLRANPRACVSFIDVFRQRGFKVEGAAAVLAPGEEGFAAAVAPLEEITAGLFPIRHVISVAVEKVSPIVAPSFSLYPDRDEAERIAETHAAYGVRPVD